MPVEKAYAEDEQAFSPMTVELPAGQEEVVEEGPVEADHDENLVDLITREAITEIRADLLDRFDSDKRSRSDWYDTYVDGLDLLGMKVEDRVDPWPGACGVFHPILAEAVVRFQSNAIVELFPAAGPVKPLILGRESPEKIQQAQRVAEEMNYQLTENMAEYRSETEQLLFRLPLAGSCFRKVYYDDLRGRPCSMVIPAEDFVVDNEVSDLETCERATHVMRKSGNEIRKLQASGLYVDYTLSAPSVETDDVKEKENELSGVEKQADQADQYTLLEMHVDYVIEDDDMVPDDGLARPYIITIDKTSDKIISIYRNWNHGDERYRKRDYFVKYTYMPGFGFYGFGLIHLLGSIAKSSTAILRQLVDAGTLSNLPGGLKTKGLRTSKEDEPIRPGEWREINVGPGAIRDNLFPLPYQEPSGVLYNLLNTIVEEGRRIGSIADVEVGDMKENSPVGTTLALLERSMKVMSAVHARIHASIRKELALVSKCIGEYMPPQYEWDLEGKFDRQKDFDGRVDIIPVSDPNAATMSAKVVQFQAVMQMVQANPDIYNLPEVHKSGLEILGVKDIERLIPSQNPPPPLDPVSENMNVLTGQPIKAYMEQDHEAHLQTHITAMMDPKMQQIIGQSPNAALVQKAMEAHIAEHLAFQYRRDIEEQMGSQLPPPGQPLPPEVEAGLSRLVAQASQKVLEQHKQEFVEEEAEALRSDPAFQLREREVAIKELQAKHKAIMDENKLLKDTAQAASKELIDLERIRSQERQTAAKIGADMAMDADNLSSKEKTEGLKVGAQIAKDIREDVRESQRMTQEANDRSRRENK